MSEIHEAALAQATLEVVSQTEKKLDAALTHYNTNDLESLRRQRLDELKQRSVKEAEWRSKGHGVYQEIADQKEWFEIDAEKTPFLAERLSVVLLPTLIMTKDNFTADRLEGFDELGGRDTFTTEELEMRLAKNGMIDYEPPSSYTASLGGKKPHHQNLKSNPTGKAIYATRRMIDSEDEKEEDD